MQHLDTRIQQILQTPVLLVATDFDGTLAPIVDDPAQAEAHPGSIAALEQLACLPQTHCAVISGRSLSDLAAHLADAPRVQKIGSHGSEMDQRLADQLSIEARQLLASLIEQVERVAATTPGSIVERKPVSVTFHYRNADAWTGGRGVEDLLQSVHGWPGVHVRMGKMVVELAVMATNKGCALQQLRQRVGAGAVLFIGDDVTDEDAFAMLGPTDLGIKVGEGVTISEYRLTDPAAVTGLLGRLVELRGGRQQFQ